jgi:putative transposase
MVLALASSDIPSQVLTFKYRLLLNKRQHDVLQHILDQQRDLYNAALQERRDAYRKSGKTITLYDQNKSLTEIRQTCDGWSRYPVRVQRGTLKRLDEAFQGFFARVKQGGKAGFPRFKGIGRFQSFEFTEFFANSLRGNRVYFKGLPGGLRVHLHRREHGEAGD